MLIVHNLSYRKIVSKHNLGCGQVEEEYIAF